jgi:hypothetical protein
MCRGFRAGFTGSFQTIVAANPNAAKTALRQSAGRFWQTCAVLPLALSGAIGHTCFAQIFD